MAGEHGLNLLAEWLKQAGARVTAAGEADPQLATTLGVSPASSLYALAHRGSLALDHGWLRVLGGRELAGWNGHSEQPVFQATPGLLVVGVDRLAGVFALDGGALGEGRGEVHYFAPDSLRWEPLGMGCSGWLQWALLEPDGLNEFYASLRWPGWPEETAGLTADQGIHCYPPLWSAEGRDPAHSSRRAVELVALVAQTFEQAQQIAGPCPGLVRASS